MLAAIDTPDMIRPFHATEEEKGRGLKKKVEKYDVLLVEDDKDDRLLALKTLKRSPYIRNIHFFRSGDDLMEYFTYQGYYSGNLMRFVPTLILLDIHVPGTSGMEILKELKQDPITGDMPVIVITADKSHEVAERARNLYANAFMTKPLDLQVIHEVILTGWGWPEGLPPGQGRNH